MDNQAFLKQLALTLKTPGMPTQSALASAAKVDQPLISRIISGEVRRVTARVIRLSDYANMRAKQLSASKMRTAQLHDESEKHSSLSPMAMLAMEACRTYLTDGCDPGILCDQIEILRRAQKFQRYRRTRLDSQA